tara:strand:+ start:876 stop:1187 length:312 start_codon:yes stop_codon:yes gene_type:complete
MDIVENLCGAYPVNFQKPDIASNPNYVFPNDVYYNARQLFDSEGTTVFVNSFIECQHYVIGGWNFTPIKNLELSLHNYLLVGITIGIIAQLVIPKLKVFQKNE